MTGRWVSPARAAAIVWLMLGFSAAFAAKGVKPKRGAAPLAPLLAEVEKKYEQAATLKADFTQENEIAALGQIRKSTGTLIAKRPGKILWDTLSPDPSTFVTDGKQAWFYTPPFAEGEQGQVTRAPMRAAVSRLASALLSGSFSMARDFEIVPEGTSEFTLVPKPGAAGTVMKAKIWVDSVRKEITRVSLEHRDGNRSSIQLADIRLGAPVLDSVFSFKPPPGTQVLAE